MDLQLERNAQQSKLQALFNALNSPIGWLAAMFYIDRPIDPLQWQTEVQFASRQSRRRMEQSEALEGLISKFPSLLQIANRLALEKLKKVG